MKHHIFLLLGSNLGDRAQNLEKAYNLINERVGIVIQQSSIYQTAAWGNENQPPFLNQALEITSTLTPEETLQTLLSIEEKMGRLRTQKWAERNIDIDIILFDNRIIDTATLKIPHPEMANRRFVLAPLAEIAPNYIHPVSQKTIKELLQVCPDPLLVKEI